MSKFKITVGNPGGRFCNPLLGLDRDEYATRDEACEAIYSRLYDEIDREGGCEMVDPPDLSGLDDEAYSAARSRYIEDCRAYIYREGYATSDGVRASVEELKAEGGAE